MLCTSIGSLLLIRQAKSGEEKKKESKKRLDMEYVCNRNATVYTLPSFSEFSISGEVPIFEMWILSFDSKPKI